MNRMMLRSTAVLLITAILLLIPASVLADGGESGYVVAANGYQIELVFKESVAIGENQFHIQITDSTGMPVTGAEVEVSVMPAKGMSSHDENNNGMEMATEAPSVGVMTSNNSMDGMEMATEVPSTGVMRPNNESDAHAEEPLTIMLEPAHESGEYAGKINIDKSGDWVFNVHFTVNGEATKVDFPVEIARALGLNYAVLGGFFGINAIMIVLAASLKRNPVVLRK